VANNTKYDKDVRDYQIAMKYFNGTYSQRELAEAYCVSRATVRRAIDDYRSTFDQDNMSGKVFETDTGTYYEGDDEGRSTNEEKGQPKWVEVGAALITGGLAFFVGFILTKALL
jgi:hypothetical protein